MSVYRIHPIVLGTKQFDKGMMTYQHDYGKPFTIPIYAWYLEGGEHTILVDTGEMHPIQSAQREEAIGGRIYTFEQGLARFNLKPEDIDMVLHTHLHNDHCENDYKCSKARFYVHEKELEHIHNPHPLDFRYLEDYIEDVETNGQIEVLTGDREIVPGIRMVHTPAHTPGGMSVFVKTARGTAVITGFCLIMENFFPPPAITGMEMEVIPPGTHINTYAAYDMVKKIKEQADILIPLHEPSFATGEPIG
ncbi:N-acyl homoserine lactonase family protein [Desulfoplanes formicivorans]|uniref:Beta-lactamase n=1 Tax=Desulfoplanes formicivorans TaxID=1592317 RepID=A0A194AGL6_9BACT|nr:N-acyl homoserine lactonase family protein [Desulfoplanes formicivorans]GAU09217.1 beta-lactamase [Desulfoplanes formicivorans]